MDGVEGIGGAVAARGPASGRGSRRAAVAVPIAVAALLVLADLQANAFATVAVAPVLGGLGLVGIVRGWLQGRRRPAILGALCWATLFLAVLVSGVAVGLQRRASMRRGDALCAALERCRERWGTYPAALGELVPEFLTEVPDTAMGLIGGVPFEYRRGVGTYSLRFSAGSLIWCSRGPDGPWRCDD